MESVSPERIMQLMWAYVPPRALATALDLGMFSHLAHGHDTATAVAAACGSDPRAVRMILDLIAALGLLTKNGEHYALTAESETYLVTDSPRYMGPFVQHLELTWPAYAKLTEAVQHGRPPEVLNDEATGEEFFVKLVPMIFPMTYPQACAAAEGLGLGNGTRGVTVLDVGAGTAAWSIAMLQRDPTARAIAVDWPPVLEVTRQFTQRFGVADRYEYIAGNLREVDFGEGSCDIAVLGHICHSEGEAESKTLFRRLHRALRPGGKLVIADMVPDDDRSGPLFPLIFALNMLVHTEEGDTFTLGEYTAWLHEAGFGAVTTLENPGPSPLIVACR